MKKAEMIVLLIIICFVIIKLVTFGKDACETTTTMTNTYCNELDMVLQEDVR